MQHTFPGRLFSATSKLAQEHEEGEDTVSVLPTKVGGQ